MQSMQVNAAPTDDVRQYNVVAMEVEERYMLVGGRKRRGGEAYPSTD